MNPLKVLVVDDEPNIRDLLSASLRFAGHQVLTSPNGTDAINKIVEQQPDIILLDIFLPGESGLEGIPYLKGKFPAAKIIMLTAYNEDSLIINCIKQGASGYALKTAQLSHLIDVINQTSRTGSFIDELSIGKVISILQSKKESSFKDELTFREKEIVALVEKGYSYKQMSDALFVTTYTINYHLKNIYKKLNIHSKSALLSKIMDESKG
jgi:DNA-binding NarL/FixJ family response regulator